MLLKTMVDASDRVNKRRKGDSNTPGATPSRSQTNTPNRSRGNTPNRSRANTPNSAARTPRTPGGREIEEDVSWENCFSALLGIPLQQGTCGCVGNNPTD